MGSLQPSQQVVMAVGTAQETPREPDVMTVQQPHGGSQKTVVKSEVSTCCSKAIKEARWAERQATRAGGVGEGRTQISV